MFPQNYAHCIFTILQFSNAITILDVMDALHIDSVEINEDVLWTLIIDFSSNMVQFASIKELRHIKGWGRLESQLAAT